MLPLPMPIVNNKETAREVLEELKVYPVHHIPLAS